MFDYGVAKYAKHNWVRGMQWSIPIGCALRHAIAVAGGEAIDHESGLLHVGHYMCNLIMLAHFVDTYPDGNDLPPPECFMGGA